MGAYNIVYSTEESTVVSEYQPDYGKRSDAYQREADLEKNLIRMLCQQGYEHLPIHNEKELVANLRRRLEELNHLRFTDGEWERFFKEKLASSNEGIEEKTRKIQEDHVQNLVGDDGMTRNITLIDKKNIHNNRLQVVNQYEASSGARPCRYDVTILVNGLPLVHIELKRRGIPLREAFNQIDRYQRDSFWSEPGLFQYVQIFVISNGTNTKYYSNTTRSNHVKENQTIVSKRTKRTSNSFKFTTYWADGSNRTIPDLVDFTKTFLAKRAILNILTKYCVFTSENMLLVMRPYQIAATERILNRIEVSTNYRKTGTIDAGGYIWHTTGSGKTLTSFKTARLASSLPYIDKVLFVVDRRDLDYQTIKEYDRFEKGAADGNRSTAVLQRQLEDRDRDGAPHAYKIIVTTIQKLDVFISKNKVHPIYNKHVVIVFDECHRSQFGEMHKKIVRHFRNYHIFGFTGTPIFADNAVRGATPNLQTTEQIFGDKLHTYTIVDAINDENVLPFRIDYVNTIKKKRMEDRDVEAIDTEEALGSRERVGKVVSYILDHFDQKTIRNSRYDLHGNRLNGFNSIFATDSIALCRKYYSELKRQCEEKGKELRIATIYSFSPNEEAPDGLLDDESFDTGGLDQSSRDFLDGAIGDYNKSFKTNFDTSAQGFQDYYKDLSQKVKERQIDLLLVVNMFLTGFDATTVNTLWVDKNLRMHGLLQAFSRTNRILNSVKTFGNIVCFRNLEKETEESIALFGDKEAGGIVLLKTYDDYYNGYTDARGRRQRGYKELVETLLQKYPLGEEIIGEKNEKDFITLFGKILRVRNILAAFDQFEGNEILKTIDFQDYTGRYWDLYDKYRHLQTEKDSIIEDVVFEVELVKQIEVNIDYILMLVSRYQASHNQDKEILVEISKAVRSSPALRSKKELIERFIETVNATSEVVDDWRKFVRSQLEADLAALIAEERLKAEETRKFVINAFWAGNLKTTGTDMDLLLPPVSRFGGAGLPDRDALKRRVIGKLQAFFDKYAGLLAEGDIEA